MKAEIQAALDYLRLDRDALYESHFDPKIDGLSPEDTAMIAEVDEIIGGLVSVIGELPCEHCLLDPCICVNKTRGSKNDE